MVMTTQGQLVQHGDDLALLLDSEMLKQLNIGADTKLDIVVDGSSLIVTVRDEEHRAKLHHIMEDMNQQYAETFRKLAE
jgi:antitoxin component of MazEF toxin-antitoxin module